LIVKSVIAIQPALCRHLYETQHLFIYSFIIYSMTRTSGRYYSLVLLMIGAESVRNM